MVLIPPKIDLVILQHHIIIIIIILCLVSVSGTFWWESTENGVGEIGEFWEHGNPENAEGVCNTEFSIIETSGGRTIDILYVT